MNSITFNSNTEEGSRVPGTIELNERFVLLEANWRAQAQEKRPACSRPRLAIWSPRR
jgi:hypothetical protein